MLSIPQRSPLVLRSRDDSSMYRRRPAAAGRRDLARPEGTARGQVRSAHGGEGSTRLQYGGTGIAREPGVEWNVQGSYTTFFTKHTRLLVVVGSNTLIKPKQGNLCFAKQVQNSEHFAARTIGIYCGPFDADN